MEKKTILKFFDKIKNLVFSTVFRSAFAIVIIKLFYIVKLIQIKKISSHKLMLIHLLLFLFFCNYFIFFYLFINISISITYLKIIKMLSSVLSAEISVDGINKY